jgi:starch phosphorylase
MVRHTLGTLGPKVLASRMVREYVTRLYTPAAISSREMRVNNFALAAEVSSWKTHVHSVWPELKVDHVESHGVGDAVLLGTQIMVKAFVSLANLTTDDVVVQIVFGRVDADDRIVQAGHSAMAPVEQYEGNRWQYQISLSLEQNGPFGYTVRMLPRHRGLAAPEELGLQVLAQGIAINSEEFESSHLGL